MAVNFTALNTSYIRFKFFTKHNFFVRFKATPLGLEYSVE